MVTVLWKSAAVLIGSAALFVAFVALMQDRMLFPRWAITGQGPTLRADAEHLRLDLPGGHTLAGVRLPARLPGGAERAMVLGFGGNAWHAHALAAHLCELFPARDVVAFYYRGYGPSTGRPSAAALNADALAIFDELRRRNPDRPVVGVGLSIGAGPAAHLAARRDLAGLILVTPFDTLEALVRSHFPYLPVRTFLRHEMEVAGDIARFDGPVAVIAAELDEIVPPARTQALREAVPNPVFDRVIAGAGHNALYARRVYVSAMREALGALDSDPEGMERPRAETGGAVSSCTSEP